MLVAVIMAGGKGSRFWPMSTDDKPKQFLNLVGEDTMIQMTYKRISKIVSKEKIFICTNNSYKEIIKQQLTEIKDSNIIIEPEAKNTAPCILLSALLIQKKYPGCNMLVVPSDHLINNECEFQSIVKMANEYLKINDEKIITLGMNVKRPEVGYGYIKFSREIYSNNCNKIFAVEKFVEKPNKELADKYFKSDKYLWNSGIFMWNCKNIVQQIREYVPELYKNLFKIIDMTDYETIKYVMEIYKFISPISIDYAVLEKSNSVCVIPSDIGWDDIGSWSSIERYRVQDKYGNIKISKANFINGNRNLIVSSNNKVIINNINDIYVVENNGTIIIGRKSEMDEISKMRYILGE